MASKNILEYVPKLKPSSGYMVSEFIHDTRRWGISTAIWNFRFNLAYRIGGFTHARR